jgi:disulfide bond formation protein DsbB
MLADFLALPARRVAVLLLALSAAIVGSALVSQYGFGLIPCPLCLYQRWPWYATIAVMLVVLLACGPRGTAWAIGLSGLVILAGMVVALYHVGIEERWIQGPVTCSGDLGQAQTVEQLRQQLMGQAIVRCDETQWRLFGVSMAGYNALASLAVGGFALWTFARLRRERAA